MPGKVLVATRSFATEYDGRPIVIKRGERVRDGHAIAKANPEKFQPADESVRFEDVEQMTAAPGEKRGGRHAKTTTTKG